MGEDCIFFFFPLSYSFKPGYQVNLSREEKVVTIKIWKMWRRDEGVVWRQRNCEKITARNLESYINP